jgi:GT2 family glycosyltransferase
LTSCIDSLLQQTLSTPPQIIVVHSGPDSLPSEFRNRWSTVQFIETEDRLYAGEARNRGSSFAKGQYLLFIDADCIPSADWAQSHLNVLQQGAKITTGPVLPGPPDNPDGFAEYLIEFAITRKPPFLSKPMSAPACNFAMEAYLFHQMNGFPNNHTGQDLLFNLRLRKQNHSLDFTQKATVYHICRAERSIFLKHRDQIGAGLGEVTYQAEKEGLFQADISAEYQFLRIICRSPFGCLLIGAKLFRIALLILRGDWTLLSYILRNPLDLLWGLIREGISCRKNYVSHKNNGAAL